MKRIKKVFLLILTILLSLLILYNLYNVINLKILKKDLTFIQGYALLEVMSRSMEPTILKNDFIQNNKWLTLNCTIKEYVNQAWNGGVFREEPTREVIREYCSYAGINENIATQYFNKYCTNGCKTKSGKIKKIKEKDQ